MKWDCSLFTIRYRSQTFSGIFIVDTLYFVFNHISSRYSWSSSVIVKTKYFNLTESLSPKIYLSLWFPERPFTEFCMSLCYIIPVTKWTVQTVFPVIVLCHFGYQVEHSVSCHCVTSFRLPSRRFRQCFISLCYIVVHVFTKWTV